MTVKALSTRVTVGPSRFQSGFTTLPCRQIDGSKDIPARPAAPRISAFRHSTIVDGLTRRPLRAFRNIVSKHHR